MYGRAFAADGLNFECSTSAMLVRARVRPAKRAAVIDITSRQNPFVQRCRALARHRDAGSGEVLLDGLHLLSDALAAGVSVTAAAAPADFWQGPVGASLAASLASAGAELYTASRAVLEAASPVRTPTGIVAIARRAPAGIEQALAGQPALVVCADRRAGPGQHRRHHPGGGGGRRDRRDRDGGVGRPVRMESPARLDGKRLQAAGCRRRRSRRGLQRSPRAGRADRGDGTRRRTRVGRGRPFGPHADARGRRGRGSAGQGPGACRRAAADSDAPSGRVAECRRRRRCRSVRGLSPAPGGGRS